MAFLVTGLKENIAIFNSYEQTATKKINAVLNKYGSLMVDYAKGNHRYEDRTGELTRSIKFSVQGEEWKLNFFLDGNMTVTSKGRKYSTFQHDGTYDDYVPSDFSERYSNTSGRSGIKHDHFMVRAFQKYKGALIVDLRMAIVESL